MSNNKEQTVELPMSFLSAEVMKAFLMDAKRKKYEKVNFRFVDNNSSIKFSVEIK